MASGARLAGVLVAVGVVAGCGLFGPPEPPALGAAGQRVTVVRGAQVYRLTAEITGWAVKPHPQVPEQGPAVNLSYRFTGDIPSSTVELLVCAVDQRRVVLLCSSAYANSTTDLWLGPAEGIELSRTAEVLLFPDQMDPGPKAGDPKDHDGYVPPKRLGPGDRVP
ncbi:hypothetical protein M8C13_34315 [Crossiella sp. SN42]|uniref:hypothetical protein n=1 Tax=Crossiella sp. SN42 TaxID=2944808 RepID=UPI00207C7DA5|nr:hypothetical protein [Crossiella sp. SN42]MCO1580843.1 hypothetical protein [Crossiella sp. SN42]